MSAHCPACLWADTIDGRCSELPERERYAFSYATGFAIAMALVTTATRNGHGGFAVEFCPMHLDDFQRTVRTMGIEVDVPAALTQDRPS